MKKQSIELTNDKGVVVYNINYTIIDDGYDRDTGLSYVKLKTKDTIFTGFAKVHEDDKDYANRLTGCSFAEKKAMIKMINYEIHKIKYTIDYLNNMRNNHEIIPVVTTIVGELEFLESVRDELKIIRDDIHDMLYKSIATQDSISRKHKAKSN